MRGRASWAFRVWTMRKSWMKNGLEFASSDLAQCQRAIKGKAMLNCLKAVLPLEAINPKYRRNLRCRICGKQFVGHYSRSLCSDQCRATAKRIVGRCASQKLRDSRRRPPQARKCQCCAGRFASIRKSARYCSPNCRLAAWRSEARE